MKSLKSLAVVGVMFLSMGLFAQQSARRDAPVRVQVVRTCDRPQNNIRPAVRPGNCQVVQHRRVDARNSVNGRRHVEARRAPVQGRKTVAPKRR